MNKNPQSKNRNDQSNSKRETKSSGRLKFFYILMLLLTIFSLVLRVSGARQGTTARASGGTAARVLVFHLEETNSCEDLVITSSGAVFSNCGNGIEKQYALNASERAQLQAWVEQYSPVNYEHNNPSQVSVSKTQLYLNGRGNRQAGEADIQQLIAFAEALASKIASQS
jgi:hypothetical protein